MIREGAQTAPRRTQAHSFTAATEVVSAASPDTFPIRGNVGVVVVSRHTLPEPDGYGPVDALIEVLVDAGVLADERLVASEGIVIDPTSVGYSITLESVSL